MMDACEFGIYCKLLFASWIQEKPCYIKNDTKLICRLCNITLEQWNDVKESILKKFKTDGDYLVNDTLLEIYLNETKTKKVKKKQQLSLLTTMLNYTFEQFWNDYDKKVGSTERLIPKWMKLTNDERDLIRAYIPKYKAAQPDKTFRKNPETFLNQKGWTHEIIIKKEYGKRIDNANHSGGEAI
jgi:hypothetical protein